MSVDTESMILVVDDNTDFAENLKEILEEDGVRVQVASNGVDALQRISNTAFDLVITDIRMPGMDGIEMLKTINQRWPNLPVIVMTAYSADAVLEEAYTEGALDVISKPVNLDHLISMVSRVTEPNAPVLLVEDDRNLRVNLSETLLEVARVLPHVAPDYTAAQRLAEIIDFRVAIIDAVLPDGDGIQLGHELKKQNEQLAVIYITGFADKQPNIRKLLELPRMHLLEKPFSPDKLLALVRNVVA